MISIESVFRPGHGLVVGCLLALAHGGAQAGGFYLPEIATPGSIGSAGAANPTNTLDASSAITNPAAMVLLEEDRAYMVGGQIMSPDMSFDSDIATGGGSDGGNAADDAFAPGFSYAWRIDDKNSVGLGMSALMGGGVDYGSDFVGRYQAISATLTGAGLTASYGYRINDEVSVGIGATGVYTTFEQDIAIRQPMGMPDGRVSLEDLDGWDPQFTLGLTWRLNPKTLLGFVYRSKAEIELDGKLETRNLSAPPFTLLDGQDITLEFDAPEVYEIGLRFELDADTTLFLEADIERFSQFDQNYLTVDNLGQSIVLDRDWEDTWRVSAAILKRRGPNLFAWGIGYDSSPVDDEDRTFDLPADEQLRLAFAWGHETGPETQWALTAEYIWLGENKIDQTAQGVRASGEFDASMLIVGANFERRF
ncbi:MAG: outer membrane protein transport protein [Gammaproteobacteria bacterium]|nr:outer membrane protein transport protein [Gammaproteobacteria bacterium]